MPWISDVMLFGWPVAIMAMFMVMPPRRAAAFAFILGWLFLPVAVIEIRGLPNLGKVSSTGFGVILGMLFLDKSGALYKFRPSFYDLPMLIWSVTPLATSISNGLGLYDGYMSATTQMFMWGVPYLIGRVYFCDGKGMKELMTALVTGALIYLPFVLFEVRMSPQLHYIVYGKYQHAFEQTIRLGGWRPMVFMNHGLMLSMFVVVASLALFWLWRTRYVTRIWSIPVSWLCVILLVTALLCRSTGAIGLLLIGITLLLGCAYMKTTWPLLAICIAIPIYIFARVGVGWDGQILEDTLTPVVGEERVSSLMYRVRNEVRLVDHANNRFLLGWGGWGRAFQIPSDEETFAPRAVPDSMWIIAFAQFGVIGLVSLFAALLMPMVILFRRLGRHIDAQNWAPVVAGAIVMLMFTCDLMVNAMVAPFYMVCLGGLAGIAIWRPPVTRRATSVVGPGASASSASAVRA
jgi:hypothetical protein